MVPVWIDWQKDSIKTSTLLAINGSDLLCLRVQRLEIPYLFLWCSSLCQSCKWIRQQLCWFHRFYCAVQRSKETHLQATAAFNLLYLQNWSSVPIALESLLQQSHLAMVFFPTILRTAVSRWAQSGFPFAQQMRIVINAEIRQLTVIIWEAETNQVISTERKPHSNLQALATWRDEQSYATNRVWTQCLIR